MALRLDPKQANLLVPSQDIQQVSPWHAARTSIVQVNPDPDAGDVFKVGSRYDSAGKAFVDLYCMGKPALMRIAAAAGIVWSFRDSGVVSVNSSYVCYKAVAAVRLPDGSFQPILANKEIDLEVIEAELRDQALKKVEGGVSAADAKIYKGEWRKVKTPQGEKNVYFLDDAEKARYVEASVHTNMIQWRKNKLMRAETGAMLRVIRAALGIKSQYTEDELKKPFIVPRIDFSPDYSDPEVRNALLQHGVEAMSNLFGQSTPPRVALGTVRGSAAPELALPGGARTAEPIDVSGQASGEDSDPWAGSDDSEPETSEVPAHETEVPGSAAGHLFGDVSAPPEGPQPARASHAGNCDQCGTGITEKVLAYSQSKFGRPLCYKCQKEAGVSA